MTKKITTNKKKLQKKYFTTHFFYNKCKRCQKRKKQTLKHRNKKGNKTWSLDITWSTCFILLFRYAYSSFGRLRHSHL